MLRALRQADLEHWNRTGGDFLSTTPVPQPLPQPVKTGILGRARILLLAGTTAALLAGCTGSTAGSPEPGAVPPEVPVRTVAGQPVPWRAEFTGQTAASEEIEIRARVGGYLVGAPLAEGEHVPAGTVLFEIDSRPFVAAHARAHAEVNRAQASVKLARQELARAERLAKEDAIAVEELERRRTEVETAGAQFAAAVAQRGLAALDVEFTRVQAPVAGRVGRALVRPGNLITGGTAGGTLLTTLVATTPLQVLFHVDEPAYQRLAGLRAAGQAVRAMVRLGSSPETFEASLDYLAPFLDPRTGSALARLVLPNRDGRLAPGLFARVTLEADTGDNRLLVPETAIGALQGHRYVFVVGRSNQVEQRMITLGERRGESRVVDQGLQPGEMIVLNALHRVRPGSTVQPVESSLAAHP